jgi:hypothetical protein
MLTDDVAQVIGYHDLVKKPADGSESSSISLRFTHIVQNIDREWVIVHSHETIQQAARRPMSPVGELSGARSGEPGAAGPPGPPGAPPDGDALSDGSEPI